MAKFELKLPKMGESVAEATITNWLKEVGDTIEEDEAVLEIATDKVDSEVPSEVEGTLVERLFGPDDVVKVGQTIAIIETDGDNDDDAGAQTTSSEDKEPANAQDAENRVTEAREAVVSQDFSSSDRFYSPLVKSIAKEENIGLDELESIQGTGKEDRVTKKDILAFIENRGETQAASQPDAKASKTSAEAKPAKPAAAPVSVNGKSEAKRS